MKELLVGSVYFGGAQNHNETWFALQRAFLRKTTPSHDQVVVLQGQSEKQVPVGMKVIHASGEKQEDARHYHAANLALLVEYFRENKDEYEGFLILDSDCFPVSTGWVEKILKLSKDKEIAAAVRLEDFAPYPHPCAIYIKKSAISASWLNFRVERRPDIYGGRTGHDTGCAIPMRRCFPLVRTNAVNLHPVCAGIYGNTFYHHGTGSRLSSNMYPTHDYYRSLGLPMPMPISLLDRLKKDPTGFIEKLMATSLGYSVSIPVL